MKSPIAFDGGTVNVAGAVLPAALAPGGQLQLFDAVKALPRADLEKIGLALGLPCHESIPTYDLMLIVAGELQAAWFVKVHQAEPNHIAEKRAQRVEKYQRLISSLEKGETVMKTKGSKKSAAKESTRKPRLAPFVDSAFNIYITFEGKEYTAKVRADGMIVYNGKEFFSPSAAAMAINGNKKRSIDGWHFFTFQKGEKRVTLDTLRGSKSPLKCVDQDAPKRKPKAAKKASKANGAAKPKRAKRAKHASRPPASAATTEAESPLG